MGVLRHPRSTMAALVAAPTFLGTWLVLLVVWAACGGLLLSTDVGKQALVDDRVRMTEALGGQVDDAQYAALQRKPPLTAYFVSGGRVLLAPPLTVLAALGLMAMARRDGQALRLGTALAIAVHASVVLVVQQVVATPLHMLRESLTSPANLALFFLSFDDGSLGARLFGSIELFGLWWVWLLALGLAAVTGRPARRYLGWMLAVYAGVAAAVAAGLAAIGGS